MKKLLFILLTVIAMFSLVSCQKNLPNNQETSVLSMYYENNYGGEEIGYSLDKGTVWQRSDNSLTEFDIWNIEFNEEVSQMIFFAATTYAEFNEKIKEYRQPREHFHLYLDDDAWDEISNIFNKEYFDDYILLFYYKYEPNISKNYVYNVIIKENSLFLNVNRFAGFATALSSWLQMVTIKKSDVAKVDNFNVALRTITTLKSTVTVYPKSTYLRDIYVNGLDESAFCGLDNLEAVNVWTWNINIDIKFNETISEERLNSIIEILNNLESIKTVGYTSNTWLRVAISNNFYDKYNDKTLTLNDILEDNIPLSNNFTMDVLSFIPIAIITLELKQCGKDYAEAMMNQLKELKLDFIDYEEISLID